MLGRPGGAAGRLGGRHLVRRHRVGHLEQVVGGPALRDELVAVAQLHAPAVPDHSQRLLERRGLRRVTSTASVPTRPATTPQV